MLSNLLKTMNTIKNVRPDAWLIAGLAVLFVYVALGLAPFDADSYDPRGNPVNQQHFGSSAELVYPR